MSKSFDHVPGALIAAGLGANKGFWIIQPRDDEGQWIEMGADVLFRFRTGKGNLVVATVKGVYVGPSGRPGKARVLISKDDPQSGLKAGVYEVDSRNLQQFKAIIPSKDGKGTGAGTRKDKFGKPVKTLADSKLPALDDLLSKVQKITPEDLRLAKGDLTPEERAAEKEGRDSSPIADLPAGFESDNPDQVKDLLRKAGVNPDELESSEDAKVKSAKASSEDPADVAIKDALADVAYSGDTKATLDDLLKKQESLAALREATSTKRPFDLDRGDVIVGADGEEGTVLEIRLGSIPENRPALITIQKADGTVHQIAPSMRDELTIAPRRRATITRPAEPTPSTTPTAREFDPEKTYRFKLNAEVAEILRVRDQPDARPGIRELTGAEIVDLREMVEIDIKDAIDDRRFGGDSWSIPALRRQLVSIEKAREVRTDSAAPSTSEAPSTPETAPTGDEFDGATVVTTEPGLQPANFPPKDRMDDGSEFELPVLTNEEIDKARNMRLQPLLDADNTTAKFVDENNRVVDAEDPFAMLSVLAKIYPGAKFTEDGALVLHRQKDKDGRIFELRANLSAKRAIVYSMRWTNPNDPEDYKEYQHKDDRHSIKSLLRKDNGPQDLLDRLLGRTDNNGKNWGTLKFGNTKYSPTDSLFKRLKWFMSGPVKSDRHKMLELGTNAVRLAEGRATVFHKDGAVKNSEIPGLWDAFREYISSGTTAENRDVEARDDLYQVLYGIFGRAPLNDNAHAAYRKAVRAEFARQFPSRSVAETRAFNGILSSASERMRGIYREPDAKVRSIRYASKDRTRAIETGMTVEYTNNVGETSIVKVTNLIENITATPTNGSSYDYGDYVIVEDANGREIMINALKLKIMQDQNASLSAYKKNLRGEALRQRRIDLGQWEPEPTSAPATRTRPAATYLGGSGIPGQDTVISDPAPEPRLIDDFVVGEMLYNKDGRPLGIIKAVRPVTGRNGAAGMAFLYQKADGTEGQVSYALGTEITPKKA